MVILTGDQKGNVKKEKKHIQLNYLSMIVLVLEVQHIKTVKIAMKQKVSTLIAFRSMIHL